MPIPQWKSACTFSTKLEVRMKFNGWFASESVVESVTVQSLYHRLELYKLGLWVTNDCLLPSHACSWHPMWLTTFQRALRLWENMYVTFGQFVFVISQAHVFIVCIINYWSVQYTGWVVKYWMDCLSNGQSYIQYFTQQFIILSVVCKFFSSLFPPFSLLLG